MTNFIHLHFEICTGQILWHCKYAYLFPTDANRISKALWNIGKHEHSRPVWHLQVRYNKFLTSQTLLSLVAPDVSKRWFKKTCNVCHPLDIWNFEKRINCWNRCFIFLNNIYISYSYRFFTPDCREVNWAVYTYTLHWTKSIWNTLVLFQTIWTIPINNSTNKTQNLS